MAAPDPFTPLQLFSFPLYSAMIQGHEQHRDPLVAEILELSRKYPGAVRSNRHAWHSAEEFLALRSPHVAWVLKNVMDYGRIVLAKYYNDWATHELKLGHYWANVVGAGGWNAPHHHFPSHWSGVYYVSVGNIGGTAEDPSGMIEFLNPTPWHSLWQRSGNFLHGPKDGLTLMFPSSLVHFVHPHATDELRISIAYNMSVIPKSG